MQCRVKRAARTTVVGCRRRLPARDATSNQDSDPIISLTRYRPAGPITRSFSLLRMALVSPCWATGFLFACPKRKSAKRKGTPHHCRRLIAADSLRAARPERALRNSLRSDSPRAIPALATPCSAALRGRGLGSEFRLYCNAPYSESITMTPLIC